MREEQRGVRTDRAQPDVVNRLDPGTRQLLARDRLQIEVASVARPPAESSVDLLANLVAARTGARSDRRVQRPRRRPARAAHGCRCRSRHRRVRATRHGRRRRRRRPRSRSAGNRQSSPSSRFLAPRSLGRRPRGQAARPQPRESRVPCTCRMIASCDAGLPHHLCTITPDAVWIIIREQPQVEAFIRPRRVPAPPGREQRASTGQVDRDVLARGLERNRELHVVSSSRSGTGVRCAYSKCARPGATSVCRCAHPPTWRARSYRWSRIVAVSPL